VTLPDPFCSKRTICSPVFDVNADPFEVAPKTRLALSMLNVGCGLTVSTKPVDPVTVPSLTTMVIVAVPD
jgi:hypothetical protein